MKKIWNKYLKQSLFIMGLGIVLGLCIEGMYDGVDKHSYGTVCLIVLSIFFVLTRLYDFVIENSLGEIMSKKFKEEERDRIKEYLRLMMPDMIIIPHKNKCGETGKFLKLINATIVLKQSIDDYKADEEKIDFVYRRTTTIEFDKKTYFVVMYYNYE